MTSSLLILFTSRIILNFLLLREKRVPVFTLILIQNVSSFGVLLFLIYISYKSYTSYAATLTPLQLYLLLVVSIANWILSITLSYQKRYRKYLIIDITTLLMCYITTHYQLEHIHLNSDLLYMFITLIFTSILIFTTPNPNPKIHYLISANLLITIHIMLVKLFAYEHFTSYFILLTTASLALHYYIKNLPYEGSKYGNYLPTTLSATTLLLLHLANTPYNAAFDTLLNNWIDLKIYASYIKIETAVILTLLHLLIFSIIMALKYKKY